MTPLLSFQQSAAANLIQPSCCPHPALLMLPSSHCHRNFIVASYKMVRIENIKRTYSFLDKLERRKKDIHGKRQKSTR